MTRVVINRCWGGFGLSREAFLMLRQWKHPMALAEPDIGEMWSDGSGPRKKYITSFLSDIPRDDAMLLRVVEQLEGKADGPHASLKIVTIPDGVEWTIDEYDGMETVEEKHRSWS